MAETQSQDQLEIFSGWLSSFDGRKQVSGSP